jgi:hypothetical protein
VPETRLPGAPWKRLLASALIAIVAVAGWEFFARGFSGVAVGARVSGAVSQDASGNDDIGRTLAELPARTAPRIVIFGSSQIDVVKGEPEPSPNAMPFQLSAALHAKGIDHSIVDLSGPAQQVFESMGILLAEQGRLKPSVVVIGVGLFSMLSNDIRPAIAAAVNLHAVRSELAELPDSALTSAARAMLFSALPAGTAIKADSTIQQRSDSRLEGWLRGHLAMVANRRAMYNRLVDQPLRRDLVQLIQRRRGAIRTARSYEPNERYPASLAAIEAVGAVLLRAGIPFIVCILPTEHTRQPAPYSQETAMRVASDLRAAAERYGFQVVDVNHALAAADFGEYEDGSPDGLHYRARGHALVADSLAARILRLPLR